MLCLRVLSCCVLALASSSELNRKGQKTHYLRATLELNPSDYSPPSSPGEAVGVVGGKAKGVVGGVGAIGGGGVAAGVGAIGGVIGGLGAPPSADAGGGMGGGMGRSCVPYADKTQSYGE